MPCQQWTNALEPRADNGISYSYRYKYIGARAPQRRPPAVLKPVGNKRLRDAEPTSLYAIPVSLALFTFYVILL